MLVLSLLSVDGREMIGGGMIKATIYSFQEGTLFSLFIAHIRAIKRESHSWSMLTQLYVLIIFVGSISCDRIKCM